MSTEFARWSVGGRKKREEEGRRGKKKDRAKGCNIVEHTCGRHVEKEKVWGPHVIEMER